MTDRPPAPGAEIQPGMIIGRKFALIKQMALGGVGLLYEAQDLLVRRRVALKLLNPAYARMPLLVRRFLREARATAAVNHPNAVTILEMGRLQSGSYYIAQELLRGPSLREHMNACARLEVADALKIVCPVMDALSAAHRRGIVHRDVKPDNIVLSTGPNGDMVPKLVDFGAAKVFRRRSAMPTQVGILLGTPKYMAPEQVRGEEDVDSRVDVWAVGVVLSELVSGMLLFPGETPGVTYGQILHEATERISDRLAELPADFAAVLAPALQPVAQERYHTMGAFRRELAALHRGRDSYIDRTPAPSIASYSGGNWDDPETNEELEEAVASERQPMSIQQAAAVPDTPELAFDRRTAADDESTLGDAAREAEQALGRNALELAICLAEEVLDGADDELRPRMWLVYAVAQLWLGNYAECERGGKEAMDAFVPRSTGWYVAVGHVATACGARGDSELLNELYDAVAVEPGEASPARDVATCRLAVVLLRAGRREEAERLVEIVQASPSADEHSLVCAWREVVLAEQATHVGDVSVYLAHTEAAIEHFTFAGDVRNACLQRHNIGNALMQLGAYQRAEIVFRDVLDVALPMRLNLVPAALANLGFTLSRLGALDAAWEAESEALRMCAEQGNRRFEAVASVYLALILAMQRDLDAAVERARIGVATAATSPSMEALARATLAGILLLRDESEEALSEARAAMEMLQRLGGVEEGEALIRLVYMSALARQGDKPTAREAIVEARERLQNRAAKIVNPSWRRSFLHDVPEHAQTLEIAAQWLDDDDSSEPVGVSKVHHTLLGLGKRASPTAPGLGKLDSEGA